MGDARVSREEREKEARGNDDVAVVVGEEDKRVGAVMCGRVSREVEEERERRGKGQSDAVGVQKRGEVWREEGRVGQGGGRGGGGERRGEGRDRRVGGGERMWGVEYGYRRRERRVRRRR